MERRRSIRAWKDVGITRVDLPQMDVDVLRAALCPVHVSRQRAPKMLR